MKDIPKRCKELFYEFIQEKITAEEFETQLKLLDNEINNIKDTDWDNEEN